MIIDFVNFCFGRDFDRQKELNDHTHKTLDLQFAKPLHSFHPRAWPAVVWKSQRMIARLGPPTKCYRSQHGSCLCFTSVLQGGKEWGTPVLYAMPSFFSQLRETIKTVTTLKTHMVTIFSCV